MYLLSSLPMTKQASSWPRPSFHLLLAVILLLLTSKELLHGLFAVTKAHSKAENEEEPA